jgi:hypothetical protein
MSPSAPIKVSILTTFTCPLAGHSRLAMPCSQTALTYEYAELADDAPAAVRRADSVARRGRGFAVNLIAAAWRPTRKAMRQDAARAQMDVRISFRVREGLLAAGWRARTLSAHGKFLINPAEHDTPKRERAYLMTDQAVAGTAVARTDFRPLLDPIARDAVTQDPSSGINDPERNAPEVRPGHQATQRLEAMVPGGRGSRRRPLSRGCSASPRPPQGPPSPSASTPNQPTRRRPDVAFDCCVRLRAPFPAFGPHQRCLGLMLLLS